MQDLKIHIATSTVIKIVLVLLGFYFLFTIREIILLLVAAVVIAAAVEAPARWFVTHRIPRVLAVFIIYIVAILVFAGLFYFFIPPLFTQVVSLFHLIPTYLSELHLFGSGAQETFTQISQSLSFKEILTETSKFSSTASGGFIVLLSTIFGGIAGFVLVLVLSFYLSVQEHGVENFLRLITPLKSQRYVINLWSRAQRKMGLWLQGQLLLGLIIGVLVFLGLTLLGFSNALLLGTLAGVFELIPVFGPILAGVPISLIGFSISPSIGLMTIAFFIIVQQFENHVIQPLVMNKVIGISPIISIISIIIGATLGGFIGILLSIPIAAVVMEFLGDISKEKSIEAERLEVEKQERKSRKKVMQEKKVVRVKVIGGSTNI